MWLQENIQRVGPENLTFCGIKDPRPGTLELGTEMQDLRPASVVGSGVVKMETKTRELEP